MSAKKQDNTEKAEVARHSGKSSSSARPARKQRSSDLGRALRSAYDDTLRESVPDDFLNLLGKLQ